jgi:hypothetical protein
MSDSLVGSVLCIIDSGAPPYLRSMRRSDGSFRYSRRYATTPVWVTAQVLPALAGRAFPL